MRNFLFALLALFLAGASLRHQTTTAADPDHIDLGLKEVSVTLPIIHWNILDGKTDAQITPYPNVAFTLDAASHKVTLKGAPVEVQSIVGLLRFLDRDNANLTTKTIKLQHANPAATARLLNEIFAPDNNYFPGAEQVFCLPAADGISILVSGWKSGLDRAAVLTEKLDSTTPSTTSAAGEPPKMTFQFTDTPVDDILSAMEQNFGLIMVRPTVRMTTKVTIKVPVDVTEDQSIKLLNSFLTQIGSQARQFQVPGSGQPSVLCIDSLLRIGRYRPSMQFGSDPSKVPTSDSLLTQVIPLSHAKAADIKKELEALASPDADIAVNVQSNSIVITDTSTRIHAFLEKLPTLDK